MNIEQCYSFAHTAEFSALLYQLLEHFSTVVRQSL